MADNESNIVKDLAQAAFEAEQDATRLREFLEYIMDTLLEANEDGTGPVLTRVLGIVREALGEEENDD